MPDIWISDNNYERLGRLAKPFEQPDTVLSRILDKVENDTFSGSSTTPSVVRANGSASRALRMDPDSPDDLTFTRVISASFAGVKVERPKWNNLVRTAHQVARRRLSSFRELAALSTANIHEGKLEDLGFHFIPESNISIQGLAANQAWQSTLKLARHLNVPVRVVFEWHPKDSAAHPGERGILEWVPSR